MDGLNSNLDLNGDAPPAAIPGLGPWGPANVPSTRAKRFGRWAVLAASLVAIVVLTAAEIGLYHLFIQG